MEIVATIPKGRDAEIRVEVGEFKAKRMVNVRVWVEPREGGEYVPTRKGITFAAERLPALIEGLQAAAKAVQATPARAERAPRAGSRSNALAAG